MSREKWKVVVEWAEENHDGSLGTNADFYPEDVAAILWVASRLAKLEKVADKGEDLICNMINDEQGNHYIRSEDIWIFHEFRKALRKLEEKK